MDFEYHIAFSFAGEDRNYVEQVANHLNRSGVKVFYDRYEQVELWGKDLIEHLNEIYKNKAYCTVMFISEHYAQKLWPRHERRAALARAFVENREYILPVRFDDTEVPGMNESIGYLDLRTLNPEQLSRAVLEKLIRLGVTVRSNVKRPVGSMKPNHESAVTKILINDESGRPIEGFVILLVASNGTHLRAITSGTGEAAFHIQKRQIYDVFCAHTNYPAYHAKQFDPINDLTITIGEIIGIGSLICSRDWHSIPGITGLINPIHDSSNRLYIYTKNIAIDGGKFQPVSFSIGKSLHLEDSQGNECIITFVAVIVDSFLVEFNFSKS